MMNIRRLTLADAPAFRTLRLRALRDHPADFGSDHASEAAKPLSHFITQLADNHVMGAFRDGTLTGIIALEFKTKPKEAHRAFLWGVYVAPEGRGEGRGGVAGPLLDAAIAVALARTTQVELGVRAGNTRAEALYRSRGFSEYGREPNTYVVDGTPCDSLLMVRHRA